MGQELIKSAVDASVFVINLTPALIRFVMTAELGPLSAGRQAAEVAACMEDSGHHNPSITSAADDTAVASLFGVG